jgi:hypothetical protein
MAGPVVIGHPPLRQRKNPAGLRQLVAVDDDCAVMERRVFLEYRHQQLRRDARRDSHAARDQLGD